MYIIVDHTQVYRNDCYLLADLKTDETSNVM